MPNPMARFLKTLVDYTLLFTLGATIVGMLLTTTIIVLLAALPWPDDAAVARVSAFMWIALAAQLIPLVAIVSWAFGRLEKLEVSVPAGSISLDFDSPDEAPKRDPNAP